MMKYIAQYEYHHPKFNLNRLAHQIVALRTPEMIWSVMTDEIVTAIIQAEVIIPDIAFYEAPVDFVTMAGTGVPALFIRNGQGFSKDSWYDRFISGSRTALLENGQYWLYDTRYEPKKQAEIFAGMLATNPPKLPAVVDWEAPDAWGGNYTGWKNLYVFLERLKQLVPGKEIMIYTGYYYWLDHSPNPITQAASLAYFAQFTLWLAWYTTDFSIVRIPRPWATIEFLQFTSNGDGAKYGAATKSIDLSYWNGSREQFVIKYNIGGSAPPPPGGTMATAREKLGKTVTKRTSPHVISGNDSGLSIQPFAETEYVAISDDLDHTGDPAYQWLDLGPAPTVADPNRRLYANYFYPPNGQRFDLLTVPPPPGSGYPEFFDADFPDGARKRYNIQP